MNFTCSRGTFLQLFVQQQDLQSTFERSQDLSLTFRATVGPSITFSQLSVRLRVFPTTFVNFLCICGPSVNFFASTQPPATSINFLCIHWTFQELFRWQRNLLSNFPGSVGPSINFRQLSVHPQYLPSTSVNFRAPTGSSVNKLRPQNLLSTSVDFPCICRIYRKLASTFHETGGPVLSTFHPTG